MSYYTFDSESGRFPTIDLPATGRNIERLRIAAGLSVRELQNLLGLASAQAVYKWQRGEALPTIDNMLILSCLFGASVEEILVCHDD